MLVIPSSAFPVPIVVNAADIDELAHVNNTVYLRWVQEVATTHWQQIVPPGLAGKYLWVVSRHEIEYIRQAFTDTPVMAYTWVLPPAGKGFDRIVIFENSATHKRIAEVKTTWQLLDETSYRSRPIPPEVLQWFGLNE
jgi:acyl-CoA thioester hydrolase